MIHRPLSSRPVVESMEARILHSADLFGVASVVGDASQAVEQRIQPPSEAATAGATTTTARSEIAFVDAGVPDRERLLDDLRRQAQAGRPIEVIEIGADDDGIALIGRELARRSDIGAVHLLSHGEEGAVRLGNALLDGSTLMQRAGEIAGWSEALAAGADLLVYGCDVAAGSDGEALINDLAMLTGADVAASTDPTGAAARGGDWVLEATTGSIETAVALDASAQQQWDGLLATYAANPTKADGTNGSLRWAINQAKASAGADTITLAAGTYKLTVGNPGGVGEDANASGDLDVNDDVTFVGAGMGSTIIDASALPAGSADRVFHILGGTVKLQDLTIQGGSGVSQGGGILAVAAANVTLSNVTVRNSSANNGAAIYNAGTTMTLTDVTLAGNTASASGGAIYNNSDLHATRITLSGNSAGTNAGALRNAGTATLTDAWLDSNSSKSGGAVFNQGGGAQLTLDRVTVSNNTATQSGGGLYTQGAGLSATNLTLSGNSAGTTTSGGLGGGLFVNGLGVTIDSATIANNTATQSGGGIYSNVGPPASQITLSNSILSGNAGGNANLAQLSGGWNLDTDGSAGLNASTDLHPASAGLGALAANGGYAPTHALLAGSAAINAGKPGAPATDQRGMARYGSPDIGAYELANSAPTISPIANAGVSEDGTTGPIAFTVGDAQTPAGSLTVRATSSNPALVAAGGLVLGGSGASRTLAVTPLANAWGTTTVTVFVSDGSLETSTAFALTVASVNDAPSGTDATLALSEDVPYALRAADFGLRDAADSPPNALLSVTIETLPGAGSLRLGSNAVAAGAVVTAADLAAGRLVYTAEPNRHGAGYASLAFRVRDDGGTTSGGVDTAAAANTLIFDVAPVNDAPLGADRTIGLQEDGSYTLQIADFGFVDSSDMPANALLSVKLTTLPNAGTLKLDGANVAAGSFVAASDIAAQKLVYAPAANGNGIGYASFTFQVRDDGGTANGGVDLAAAPNRLTFDVAPVNDAPVNRLPAPQAVDEDARLVFSATTGNAITVSDVDATPSSQMEVSIGVTHGTLTLTPLLGAETQVNLTTASNQQAPKVAVAADGHYVVVWQSNGQDGSKNGVYARVYNADGSAHSGEIQVNSITLDDQTQPAIAIDSSGRFVIAWQNNDPAQGGTGWDVYARSFDANGVALGAAKRINNTTAADQTAPAVAIDDSGNIVVTWQSQGQDDLDGREGIYARRYTIALANVGNEFLVNTTTADAQTAPAVARNALKGDFVVTWTSKGQDGSGLGVYGQRFSSTGAKAGGEFRINTTTASDQSAPSVAMNASGDFVVAWQSKGQDNALAEATKWGIYAQRYNAAGIAQGGELLVNTTIVNDQIAPQAAITADGRFAVTWTSLGQDNADANEGVYLQGYAADGSALGGEMRLNTTTLDTQDAPSIGMDGNGRLVAVWESNRQDGNGYGVFMQRLKARGALTFLVGDGIADATMTMRGTLRDINEALEGLAYDPAANYWGSDTLTLRTDDLGNGGGAALVASGAVALTVNPVNDAPTQSLPSAQATTEDTAIVFSAANGNAITVADIDSDPNPIQLSLSAPNGTFTLASTNGLTFTSGGNGSGSLVVRGLQSDVNAALDGLRWQPNADYNGADTITVTTSDLGNIGSGGAYTVSGTIAVAISAVNDAPVDVLPAPQSVVEGNVLVFSIANGNRLALADVDAGTAVEEVTLASTNGTLKLAVTNGLTFSAGTGKGGETRITFRGTLTSINTALDGLAFTPLAGYAGPAYLEMLSNDFGNSGSGGPLGDRNLLAIRVTPNATNAAPIISIPGNQTTTEEVPITLSAANGSLISVVDDAGGSPVQVTLTVTGGVLTLASSTGPEFQVNSTVAGDQSQARIATAPAGDYVVVWQSSGQDGSGLGIYGQRYNRDGIAAAPEFRVNVTTADDQSAPEVAMDASGGFVVVWQSKDANNLGIFARRYDADGVARGGEFQVNSRSADDQSTPDVAMDAAGDFVVVWQGNKQDGGDSWGVYGQRYDATGSAVGGEFRVNTATAKDQLAPTVAMSAAGGFVVAWQSENQDGDGWGVYAQRYDTAGRAQGAEFRVNTIAYKDQTAAAIGMSDVGAFVIAWQSPGDYPDHSEGIYAQRYDAAGVAQGPQFLVNTTTPGRQTTPAVAMDGAGNFVVAWQSLRQDNADGREGIYAQRYDASGARVSIEFLVNSTTVEAQTAPSVGYDDNGRFVAVWTSDKQDGSGVGVFGQGFFDPRRLSFTAGDGVDDTTMTFTTTLDLVNDALNGMVFTPAKNFDGSAKLTVTVNDLGNSGTGGAKSASKSINITVNPVNDAPTIQVPAPQTVAENSSIVFSTAAGTAFAIGDVDTGGAKLLVMLNASVGRLTLASPGSVTLVSGTGSGDAAMSFTGTLTQIATALDGMRLDLPSHYTGDANVQMIVNDQGNKGAGGALVAAETAFVSVVPDALNEAPRVLIPAPQTTAQDTPISLSVANGNAFSVVDDAGTQTVRVTLTASNGTVSLSPTVGSEATVNTYTVGAQDSAQVAVAPDGSRVAVWRSGGQDGSGGGIYAQRVDSAGRARGPEFLVNTFTAGEQSAPAVAIDRSGQFVVAWVSASQDGSGTGVYAQRYDASGQRIGKEQLVNTTVAGNQFAPSVAIADSGAFVVVWQGGDPSAGIYAQLFDANGEPLGAETVVNTTLGGHAAAPDVAMDALGSFVVVWQSDDASSSGIYARRFDVEGNPAGGESRVNATTAGSQVASKVAMRGSGEFVVVWQGPETGGGAGDGIYAQRFDAAGRPQGAELSVNTTVAGNQELPDVAVNDSGDFVVVWQAADANSDGIYAQVFRADGSALGREVAVNTTTQGSQAAPSVGMSANGRYAVAWTGAAQDGNNTTGIASQWMQKGDEVVLTAGSGVADTAVTLVGTLADINAMLDGIRFNPTAGFNGVASIRVDVDDLGHSGTGGSLTGSASVDIVVGKAPVVDLDANDSSGALGAGYVGSFSPGLGPVRVVDADATVLDVSSTSLLSMTLRITNLANPGSETLAASTGGTIIVAAYNATTGTLMLTGNTSVANYQKVLRTVTYDNTAASPNTATRLISVVATDSRGASNTAISSLRYRVPNTAPVAQADSYTVTKGGVLTVSVPGLLANDTDANSDPLSAELASGPANGTLTLATSGSFVYTPNVGFSGGDAFTYCAFDGSLYSAPVAVSITVTPVNVAPVGTDATLTLLQDRTHVFAAADFGFTDPGDTPANALAAVQLSTLPTAGTLTLAGSAVSAAQWITAADLAAGRLVYAPDADGYGSGYSSFGFRVRDDGGTANGGVDTDTTERTLGFDVLRVNRAPHGSAGSVAALEDTPYVFAIADFGFSDTADSPADALLAVRIASLPGVGTLVANGVTVTAGQFVSGADIAAGRLVYTPAADASGASYASFTFQVQDDGGSANGGADLDPTPRRLAIDVAAVNDAPAARSATLALVEDVPYAFGVADFGLTDPHDTPGNALLSVTLVSLPGAGSLSFDGSAAAVGTVVGAADLAAGKLVFVGARDANGSAYASFGFRVRDDGGTVYGGIDTDPVVRTLTLDLAAVNDAPRIVGPADGASAALSVVENSTAVTTVTAVDPEGDAVAYSLAGGTDAARFAIDTGTGVLRFLAAPDFEAPGDADADADNVYHVIVRATDSAGTFATQAIAVTVTDANEAPVAAADAYTVAEDAVLVVQPAQGLLANDADPEHAALSALLVGGPAHGSLALDADGGLRYTPDAGYHGGDAFAYRAFDGSLYSAPVTVSITVTSVNDAPVGTDATLTLLQDRTHVFAAADFGYTDPGDTPANALAAVQLSTLPMAGTLTLAGTAVNAGQWISAADLAAGRLMFSSGADGYGTGFASLGFRVRDDGGTANGGVDTDTVERTIAFDVLRVNRAPQGSAGSIATPEDTPYVFAIADFGFSDTADSPADALLAVRIASVPGAGTLVANGTGVTAGQFVSATDIAAGRLVYTPAADASGAGYAAFTFQVQDDGGSTNGGADLDPTARRLAIDVTAVNDAPTGRSATLVLVEDVPYAFRVADFGFADPHDTPADALLSVTIASLPDAGSLSFDGSPAAVGTVVGAADLTAGKLIFLGARDGNGAAYASFTFRVRDGGGTTGGGVDTDPVARMLTLDLAAVNDAPRIVGPAGGASAALSLEENSTAVTTVTAIDPEADAIAYSLAGGADAARFAIDAGSGMLRFLAAPDFESPGDADADNVYQVIVRATDSAGAFLSQAIAVTVTDANEAPLAAPDAYAVAEDTVLSVRQPQGLLANDADPDHTALSARLVGGPGHGSLALDVDGGFVYTPDAGFHGGDAFTYRAFDGELYSASVTTVSITVSSVNDAPVGTDGTIMLLQNRSHVFAAADFGYTDPGDTPADALLAVRITSLPGAGTLVANGTGVTAGQFVSATDIAAGRLVYTPAADASGAGYAAFTFQVQDDGGSTNGGADLDPTARRLAIDVTAVNDAPRIVSPGSGASAALSMVENSTDVAVVTAVDAEGDAIAYSLAGGTDAGLFAIDERSGALRFLAAPDFEAPGDAEADNVYRVVVRATDSAGAVSTQSLDITVTDVDEAPVAAADEPPVAAADNYRADAGTMLVVGRADGLLANDADPANRPLTARLMAGPAHGLLALAADGSFSYTPATGFRGVDSFSYRAGNGSLDSTDATASITVAAAAVVDRPPLAAADAASGEQDTLIAGNVLANDTDPDGDALTATLVDGPAHGSLTLAADGSFGYRPNAGFIGLDRFDYLASDGRLQSTAATVTLTVAAVAAPPTGNGTGDVAAPGDSGSGSTPPVDTGSGSAAPAVPAPPQDGDQGPVNHAPTMAGGDAAATIVEPGMPSGELVASGMLDFDDVDAADIHSISAAATEPAGATLGSLTVAKLADTALLPDGTPAAGRLVWTYTVKASAIDHLATGETRVERYTITVDDGHGGSAARQVAVTIVGTNDAPVVVAALAGQTQAPEVAFRFALPKPTFADPDSADTLRYAASLADGQPLPAWLRFDAEQQVFSGAAPAGYAGSLLVRVTAVDPSGAGAVAVLRIDIVPPVEPVTPGAAVAARPPADAVPEAPAVPAAAPVAAAAAAPQAVAVPPPAQPAVGDLLADGDSLSMRPASPLVVTAPRTVGGDIRPSTSHASSADLVLAQASYADVGAIELSPLLRTLQSDDMLRRLAEFQQQIDQQAGRHQGAIASSIALTTGVSVGYIVWLVRGGVLVSSMLSAMPAWQMIDPLPVLMSSRRGGGGRKDDDEGADDVEKLFDRRRTDPAGDRAGTPAVPPVPPGAAATPASAGVGTVGR